MTAGIQDAVSSYYTGRVREHGACARGVDWNSEESQELRFDQLLGVVDDGTNSLLDYGCGYGALLPSLDAHGIAVDYVGFDLSREMLRVAESLHGERNRCSFTSDVDSLRPADVTIASGIFNVKLDVSEEAWSEYVLETIGRIDQLSRRGFAFNVLTSYSDAEYKRDDLHYADPCALFDHCKHNFSRHVALLHDYGLYEFTILVRKD